MTSLPSPQIIFSPATAATLLVALAMALPRLASGADAPSAQSPAWKAGAEQLIRTPNLPKPARVFLPENWDASREWPVLFFYPWTGGEADIGMMRQHTEGKNFIIVGMPPRTPGAFVYSPEMLTLEQTTLREVRAYLAAQVKLDVKRVFVSGFSKGGWLAALLLAHEPDLAGGCVLGGGWVHQQHAPPRKMKPPVYVYVGVGRLDGLFPAALRASQELARIGAAMTFDTWPDTGHALPDGGAESLRQWLLLVSAQATPEMLRKEATRWAEPEFQKISALQDPVQEWLALRRFADRPFTRALGAEWGKRIAPRIAELRKNPTIVAEIALETELNAIHQREIQDMRTTTLEAVGPRYEALANRAPDSPTGRHAQHDAQRIQKLWASVPGGKPQPTPAPTRVITPKLPEVSAGGRDFPMPPKIR